MVSLNTQAVASITTSLGSDFNIGRGGIGGHFQGLIDDIFLYDRAITRHEIKQLFEQGTNNITWSTGDTTSSITVQPTTTTTQ